MKENAMYFSETHETFRQSVRRFVDKEINPHIDEWEEKTVPLNDLFRKMGGLGFLEIRHDPRYGGMGFMNETLISRYFRDARVMSIGAGADEVMCEVIARTAGF